MIDAELMAAILDSLKEPILVADTEHVTRYMNKAAVDYYEEGDCLLGRSLLECHNEGSQAMMIEILAAMQAEGLEERLITDNESYYERYEPPRIQPGAPDSDG